MCPKLLDRFIVLFIRIEEGARPDCMDVMECLLILFRCHSDICNPDIVSTEPLSLSLSLSLSLLDPLSSKRRRRERNLSSSDETTRGGRNVSGSDETEKIDGGGH